MGDRLEHEVFAPKYLHQSIWILCLSRRVLTEGFEVRGRIIVRDVFGKMCLVDSRDQILQEGQGIESFLGDSQ